MMVSQKDQALLVEMMCSLYLRTVAPRGPSEVSLYEFMTYLRAQVEPAELPRYEAAVERQKRMKELVDRMGRQLAQGAELLVVLEELKLWAQRPPHEEELPGG